MDTNVYINRTPSVSSTILNIPGNYFRRILRLCVFQHPENSGFFEKALIRIYKLFSQGVCSAGYHASRAERGRGYLEELGAQSLTLPVSGNSIDTIFLSPKALEDKINSLGGVWEKKILFSGKEVFAIVPPTIPTPEWGKLEAALLHLKWPVKEGWIITCSFAKHVKSTDNLFIQANSASTSYVMLQKRIGLYLGCKQTVVCFDPPGTGRSSGIAYEGSYYETIKAVFTKYSQNFNPDKIWAGGACLGNISIAFLKSKYPKINLLMENGFVDMREDMVKPEGSFNLWFVNRYWDALFNQNGEESGFNIAKTWEMLDKEEGKVVVVSIKNDQRLSQAVAKKLVSVAERTSSSVRHIEYLSPNINDPHFTRIDDVPKIAKQVMKTILA